MFMGDMAACLPVIAMAPGARAALQQAAAEIRLSVCLSRMSSLQWRLVHVPPFKPLLRQPLSVENCNLVVAITRDMLKLPLVNIGGIDLLNGQRKLILAVLWQLMRCACRPPGPRIYPRSCTQLTRSCTQLTGRAPFPL
jgi:Calponin homology (CH) domain